MFASRLITYFQVIKNFANFKIILFVIYNVLIFHYLIFSRAYVRNVQKGAGLQSMIHLLGSIGNILFNPIDPNSVVYIYSFIYIRPIYQIKAHDMFYQSQQSF